MVGYAEEEVWREMSCCWAWSQYEMILMVGTDWTVLSAIEDECFGRGLNLLILARDLHSHLTDLNSLLDLELIVRG